MKPFNNPPLENQGKDVLQQVIGRSPSVDQPIKEKNQKNVKKHGNNNTNKRNKKKSVEIKKNDTGKQRSQLLDTFSWAVLEKELNGLKKEYNEEVAKVIPKKEECVAFYSREAIDKNRNPYIPCLDISRCTITSAPPSESYIHANFVSSLTTPKRFIATQAPLDNTILDFWRLVLQEKVEHIVMLCNFKEKNVIKSAEYFPLEVNEHKNFGDIKIMLMKKFPLRADDSIMSYNLNISYSKQDHAVKIYHWKNWPETGHPPISDTSLTLYAGVYTSNYPVIVHCSSGVRRTGIWIMFALFMDIINEGNIENESALKLSKKFRKQRAGAIVSDVDYVYIHRLIFQQLLNKRIILSSQRLLEFFDDYETAAKKSEKLEKANKQNYTIGNDEMNAQLSPMPNPAPSTPLNPS
ncbi:Protein-tyrosine phosphatase, receptor/non-receptor type domain and Protein-tyrosine/Dual specificity phosphatase domain and Protein-tyrosine phosphatase, catalytic domain-containing protein [Strongyloides ratti]|uniref:Protein-tyrosine phosphatase, receptor/non-receptor type domain and Protein-tyrosine/Dual specificity phosphatase domain and Protein-tyrosine phosphatase, catalytic domain-containing protein n=1 Tax=Strongyloides ratti TaxID=34506 RepID=A0A090MWX8_STRRB|nr:Protein-tyrosine phosphatase, receptor/non-receptor type domain and Protein-tyrosine/Dual specificity phosphatase domain and Protein-tyrosine phosphatase, catalytic domain-containing protein [Strongyloides ratti]CEF64459.1 Protein-tyrosine phosphatase, receptor/non-receptor type domain and Protein-tyrosine/Dual specificity phosphatase domain and Protein-tyrosine phosphatase, catalytic domain-containing protein [Strongyloides ratti]